MNLSSWNKFTRLAYVGTLSYSLLGIIVAILSPIILLGTTASFLLGGHSSGGLWVLSIVEIFAIFGYLIFFLSIHNLVKITTTDEEKKSFKNIRLAIVFDILGAVFGIFHLNVVAGILGLVSCILLILSYSSLKKSQEILNVSPSAVSGFSLLFSAEVLIIVGICLGWIPVINVFGYLLKVAAWICVLIGWKRVAKPVAEAAEVGSEENLINSLKELFAEGATDAKIGIQKISGQSQVVIEEISKKTQEATEDIKKRIDAESENIKK